MTYRRSMQSIRPATHRRAFTMAEMVVAVTIMVIVTAVVASLFVQVRKMVGMTQWSSETRAQLRTVVSTLAQDLENVDSKAYFIMLNRDYGWDRTQFPDNTHCTYTPPGPNTAPLLYPADSPTANRRIWADRLAFVANGPFNSQVANTPFIGFSARVYYGQSLWTHELTDMWWASQATVVTAALNPFQPQSGPSGPYQMNGWTGDFGQRPAVGWNLLRQAVLHAPIPGADIAPGNYLNFTREIDWRAVIDSEFMLLNSSLGLYTEDDLARQADEWLRTSSKDWAALLWSPRIDPWPAADPSAMARSRVLLPHATRLRFQIRLSDGTIIPRIDEAQDNPRLRGGLLAAGVSGWNQDYCLPLGPPAPNWTFALADPKPTGTPNSVHSAGTFNVPVKQVAYIWTPNHTNMTFAGGTTLYPVAVRIRIEVYDPQKRTPDPISLDEWLPVRWQR